MAKLQSLETIHSPAVRDLASAAAPDQTNQVDMLQSQLLMAAHQEKVLTWLTWILAVVMMFTPVGLALDELHYALDLTAPLNNYLVSALAVLVGWLALPLLNSMASDTRGRVAGMARQLDALPPETTAGLPDVKKPATNRRL